MTGTPFRITPDKIFFAVRLTPKGGRDTVEGWAMGAGGQSHLKVRVSAPPHDGAANEALLALLARALGVAKSKVRLVAGASSRIKRIEVDGDGPALAVQLSQWEKAS